MAGALEMHFYFLHPLALTLTPLPAAVLPGSAASTGSRGAAQPHGEQGRVPGCREPATQPNQGGVCLMGHIFWAYTYHSLLPSDPQTASGSSGAGKGRGFAFGAAPCCGLWNCGL